MAFFFFFFFFVFRASFPSGIFDMLLLVSPAYARQTAEKPFRSMLCSPIPLLGHNLSYSSQVVCQFAGIHLFTFTYTPVYNCKWNVMCALCTIVLCDLIFGHTCACEGRGLDNGGSNVLEKKKAMPLSHI